MDGIHHLFGGLQVRAQIEPPDLGKLKDHAPNPLKRRSRFCESAIFSLSPTGSLN